MEDFWKAAAGTLLTVVLGLAVSRQDKDISVLLSMAACAMVMVIAIGYLEPVLDFLRELEALSDLRSDMLGTLLKIVGIGLVAEIAAMECSDAGNGALGKTLLMLATAAMLYLSLPIMSSLLSLVRDILGEV